MDKIPSKHNLRFKPYQLKRPMKKHTDYHFNATLAKLQSLSNSFKTLFSRFISNDDSNNSISISQKNDSHKSDKKVQFNIIPNFLESENYEYSKDSYYYYSSSGVPSSNKSDQVPNSIIKSRLNKEKELINDSSQKWICKDCLTKNSPNQDICFLCKNFKRELNTTLLKKKSLIGLRNLASNIDNSNTKAWQCIECCYANEISEIYCKNCRFLRLDRDKRIHDNKTPLSFKNFFDEKKFSNEFFIKNKENLV